MIEINAKVDAVKKETQATQYTGTMEMGMAILVSVVIAQVFVTSLWVLNDHDSPIIFYCRIAQHWVFDGAKSLITIGFAMFWM